MVLTTAKCPSNDINIANRNNCKIWDITGEDEPDVGSTAVAIASPEEDAIFSPASAAAEKKIVRINPADTPIIISVIPITIP